MQEIFLYFFRMQPVFALRGGVLFILGSQTHLGSQAQDRKVVIMGKYDLLDWGLNWY